MYLPFCLYVFLVIVRPQEWVPALAELPILPTVLLVAFGMWLFRRDKTLNTPQHLTVPVFVAAAIVSRAAMGWLSGAIDAAGDLLPPLMFFAIGATLAEEPRDLERVLKAFCLSTFVVALHGLDQVFTDGVGWTGQALLLIDDIPRTQYVGVFGDPNDLAMLFVGCVPLCAYFARHSAGRAAQLFWLIGCGLLIYSVYLTNSRGGLVSLLGVLLLFGALRLGKVATTTVAALALPTLIAATRLTSGLDADEESVFGRVDAWYVGLQLFEQNPLFGVGYGLFTDHNELTAHNSWVLVLAETGLTGYLPWFTATTISLLMLWKMRIAALPSSDAALQHSARDRALAGTVFWSTLGMLFSAFFLSRSYNVLFFLLWAWSAGHAAGFAKRDPAFVPVDLKSHVWRWAMLAAASIVAFYILVWILLAVL
jgi:O-Antigen ligase